MSLNLDNALHGVQDTHCALILEQGTVNTPEQMEILAGMLDSLEEMKQKILKLENEK